MNYFSFLKSCERMSDRLTVFSSRNPQGTLGDSVVEIQKKNYGKKCDPHGSCGGLQFRITVASPLPSAQRLPLRRETMVGGALGEGFGFSFRLGCQWGYHRVWIVRLTITLVDFSRVDLLFVVRYF
jgi:hypothetical protein